MKKATAFCLVMILLCTMLAGIAYADGETWHCETCDADRDTAFCPVCGAKRPDPEPSVWYCPTCGKEISNEYSFCPDDGTAKPGSVSVWPKRDLTGTPVTIKPYPTNKDPDKTMRRQAYLGPDKNKYPGAGSYRPGMVTSAAALFREGDYIFVDLLYHEKEKRVVYFLDYSLQEVPASLEFVSLTGQPATVSTGAVAMMGPGSDYEVLEISVKSKYADWDIDDLVDQFAGSYEIWRALQSNRYTVIVDEGTDITVFFEYNGWLFAEFGTAIGNVRAWLPANAVVQ